MVGDFDTSVDHWYSPSGGTPDIFSTQLSQSCWNFQPNSTYPGPICLKGPQFPRTGSVFAGQFYYTIPGFNQREYIQVELTDTLIPGNYYCVEFYVSLADNIANWTTRLGALLTEMPVSAVSNDPILLTPQVSASGILNDTSAWTLVSGTFQAQGPIKYLTIGNFYDDNSTLVFPNPGGGVGPGCYGSYYFIDDVSVTSCITGLDEENSELGLEVYPNPVSTFITVSTQTNEEFDFEIIDMTGKVVLNRAIRDQAVIDISDLPNGSYFYRGYSITRIFGKGKLLKADLR